MNTAIRNELVRCPKCNQGFLVFPAVRAEVVCCGTCSASYPVDQGVIDLMPGVAVRRSLVQRVMESESVVRIYESHWWRRSVLAAESMGISFEQEQALVFRVASVKRADTVLDLACGSGIYTRPLAQRAQAGTVAGLDLSLPMLRYASQRAHQERLNNIVLIRGNALRLPFPSERFDLVNCGGALHLFPNAARALREVHRVLKPGGLFIVSAARRYSGPLSALTDGSVAFLGVHLFSASELKARCERVGLGEIQFHHAKRFWLVMSARKIADVRKRRPREPASQHFPQ